jgi:hypothetical protein
MASVQTELLMNRFRRSILALLAVVFYYAGLACAQTALHPSSHDTPAGLPDATGVPSAKPAVEQIRILRSVRISRATPTAFCDQPLFRFKDALYEDRYEQQPYVWLHRSGA